MVIRLKKNLPTGCVWTREELQCIADSLCLGIIEEGIKQVFFGEYPPADVTYPWQRTDACGVPIGSIKFYSDGAWR